MFRGYCVGYPPFRAGLILDGEPEKLWSLRLAATPPRELCINRAVASIRDRDRIDFAASLAVDVEPGLAMRALHQSPCGEAFDTKKK